MVVIESECERGEERGDDNGKGKGMKGRERRETSEDGRRKRRETVRIKMNEGEKSEMEKRK